jgi:sugar lactone lactonase YvrE
MMTHTAYAWSLSLCALLVAQLGCPESQKASRDIASPTADVVSTSGEPEVESVKDRATHQQTGTLRAYAEDEASLPLVAFCLNADGHILACCGEGPGEIRVLDGDGKLVKSWSVPVKPESIHVAADNTVLVGGVGKLFRFSPDGELLQTADAPHVKELKENADKLRQEAAQQLRQVSGSLESRIEMYSTLIDQLNAKKESEELSAQEEQILATLPDQLEQLKSQQEARGKSNDDSPSEDAISSQVENMTRMKARIASISTRGDHVYLATPSMLGYTYDVWRLNSDLQDGEVIVSGLRGCCGQMDVQANEKGIYAAENSRHRVVSFGDDGNEQCEWGGRDRTGLDGFTSCCNPMNVCFNSAGEVFTAESSTGRIKKFSAEGELLSFVGDVELVPGCKNVSIAVSPDESRVYMLDMTRNHIVVMEQVKSAAAE